MPAAAVAHAAVVALAAPPVGDALDQLAAAAVALCVRPTVDEHDAVDDELGARRES